VLTKKPHFLGGFLVSIFQDILILMPFLIAVMISGAGFGQILFLLEVIPKAVLEKSGGTGNLSYL